MNGLTQNAHDDWRPSASWATLRARADLVERTRRFFAARGLLEIDTPLLQGGANLDHGVLPFRILADGSERFLPTSPEHPLKRLLAAGGGDLWTLAPAFRRQERGRLHSPEFRMLEWYRLGWDDRRLLAETVALLAELTGLAADLEVLSWREAFRRHAGLDPARADEPAIAARLGSDAAVVAGDRRAGLDLLLTREVEPKLGRGRWTALVDYPAEASAQAQLRAGEDGALVAARFEIYRDGIELANGYHELSDGAELGARLAAELRGRSGGERQDQRFLAAMAAGLPGCAGVAVGFDRVVMLSLGLATVAETRAFAWERQ
jgi:lysyl-tRNA synthetase class 2